MPIYRSSDGTKKSVSMACPQVDFSDRVTNDERTHCSIILAQLSFGPYVIKNYDDALLVFKALDKTLKCDYFHDWSVTLAHHDQSMLIFYGAFLVEIGGWLCCFTEHHGIHIYRADDLEHYEARVLFRIPGTTSKWRSAPKKKAKAVKGKQR